MTDYDPSTALIVVDYQNDFADPAGSLYVRGGEQLVDGLNAEMGRAQAAGATVVYTQDWHPPSTPHFAKDGGPWPVHCVAGSWGAQLHPGLAAGEEPVRKGVGGEDGYSGFSVRDPAGGEAKSTGLAEKLTALAVRRVVVVGLATDYCVKETVVDALRLGFETFVLERLIRAVDLQPGDGARAIVAMREAGAVVE